LLRRTVMTPSFPRLSRPLLGLAVALAAALAAAPTFVDTAHAVRQVQNYPKIALYTDRVGTMSEAQFDTLSWYDLVCFNEGPNNVGRVRSRNADIELFWIWMPQNIVSWSENSTFWHADTSWSLYRLSQFYAQQNDWYLRDVNGQRIVEWDGHAANWTKYCPKGVYGTSRGLTYVEWLVQVAIPKITKNNPRWADWGRGSSSYTGLMLEIIADCVGSYGWQRYQFADPDRDGQAEGVFATCSQGGADDSLSVLYREQNEIFHAGLYSALPPNTPVLMNGGNKYVNPAWWTDTAGMKIETWMSFPNPSSISWWEYLYGARNWNDTEVWGPGYEWAEWYCGHDGLEDEGWDHTLLQVSPPLDWIASRTQRLKRFGFGTTLLGDGFYMYTKDQHGLFWQPEYEWDLGEPLGHFTRETYGGQTPTDTLYVRLFDEGVVEVNPNKVTLQGVPAEDSRVGFWQTVDDLAANAIDGISLSAGWSAPGTVALPVESTELRWSTAPITSANWSSATSAGIFAGAPGSPVTTTIGSLPLGATIHLAARNRVFGRLAPDLTTRSVPLVPAPPGDTTPPDRILDLESGEVQADRVVLAWTAPGDDANVGVADRYMIRRRLGGPITSEAQWNNATPVTANLPTPAPAGVEQSYLATGLSSGVTYGFAVRAVDDADNLAPLSNAFTVTTDGTGPPPPPTDTTPPGAVGALAASDVGTTWIDLTWTAPGDDGALGQATNFWVRVLADSAIESESEWNLATPASSQPPSPGPNGTSHSFRVSGLGPDTLYGIAVRARDEVGNLGPLSAPLTARTEPTTPAPDPIAPAVISDLRTVAAGQTWIQLSWTASGDDGNLGRASRTLLRSLLGRGIGNETQWNSASASPDPLPAPLDAGAPQTFRFTGLTPGSTYGFAVRARDEADNLGALSPLFVATTATPAQPPVAIHDLAVSGIDSLQATLHWSAPDDGEGGTVAAYQIGGLVGEPFDDVTDWSRALLIDGPTPTAPGSATTFVASGLTPSTLYGFAVRSWDAQGAISPLSNFVSFTTLDPPRDTTATSPAPIEDLRAEWSGAGVARLRWTAVAARPPPARLDHYVVRFGRTPSPPPAARSGVATVDSVDADGLTDSFIVSTPPPRDEGEEESFDLADLASGFIHRFAIVSVDDLGQRALIGNIFELSAPANWPDTIPPAAISDLSVEVRSPRRARFTWTETGDDGSEGVAARFVVGVRSADVVDGSTSELSAELPIENETDWAQCDTTLIPANAPQGPGSGVSLTTDGLTAERVYVVAVRARDEIGNLSPLGAPVAFETPAWPDTVPPKRVRELFLVEAEESALAFVWIAPSDSLSEAPVDHYAVGWSLGAAVDDEAAWVLAVRVETEPGSAAAPGARESWRIEGLPPDAAVGIAVRAVDAAGLLGPLSAPLVARTAAVPLPPNPPPAAILDLRATRLSATEAEFEWTAVGEDSSNGRAARYAIYLRAGATIESEADLAVSFQLAGLPAPDSAGALQRFQTGLLDPAATYGVALFAFDAADQRSPLVGGVMLETLPPPPPWPDVAIVRELRVESVTEQSARLRFVHPTLEAGAPRLARYEVRWRIGEISEASFATGDSLDASVEPSIEPDSAGVEAVFIATGLTPDTPYALAIRTWDESGRASVLSGVVQWRTLPAEDLAPPAPPRDVTARWDGETLEITWSPSIDLRVVSYRIRGREDGGAWRVLSTIAAGLRQLRIPPESAAPLRQIAVTSLLANSEESSSVESSFPGSPSSPSTTTFSFEGPFPHPIVDDARFRIHFASNEDRWVEVTIRDVTGRVRRRLQGEAPSVGPLDLLWDRRDQRGERCGPGFYFATVRAGRNEERRTIYLAP